MIRYDSDLKYVLEKAKIDCSDCVHCCKFQGGFVLPNEIKKISVHFKMNEEKFKEKYLEEHTRFNTILHRLKSEKSKDLQKNERPFGPCVLLGRNGCIIQDIKPLHCRVGSCNEHGENTNLWFILRHFLNPNDMGSLKEYAMYLRTGGKTLPGANLHEIAPEKINEIMNGG